jgi:hypothetical protein
MKKIKLSKLQKNALLNMFEKHTTDQGTDFVSLNRELNEPYQESNKRFWKKLTEDQKNVS